MFFPPTNRGEVQLRVRWLHSTVRCKSADSDLLQWMFLILNVYLFVNFHLFYQFVFMIALLMFLSISLFSREVFWPKSKVYAILIYPVR